MKKKLTVPKLIFALEAIYLPVEAILDSKGLYDNMPSWIKIFIIALSFIGVIYLYLFYSRTEEKNKKIIFSILSVVVFINILDILKIMGILPLI